MRRTLAVIMIMLMCFGVYTQGVNNKNHNYMIMPEKLDLDKILVSEESKNKKK